MKAVIVGPSAVTDTLAPVLEQRGVTVIDRVDDNSQSVHAFFEQQKSKPDLVLLFASEDFNETRSMICGLQILLGKPILVLGVARSVSEVVQIMRSGAADFIEMSGDFIFELDESLRRLFDSEKSTRRSGQVISIVSAVGGAGQTAIASNLAVHLAKTKQRSTVLADLKMSGGDAAEQLGLSAKQTIADCPQHADEIHTVLVNTLLEQHKSGLKVVAGPAYLGSHGIVPAKSMKALVSLLAQLHEFVVLDLEDAYHAEQQAAIACSDLVVIVMRLDFPCVLRTKRLIERFEKKEMSNLYVVANNYIKGTSIPENKVESVLKRQISAVIPHEPASVLNGINMGEPAVLEFPRSKFSQAISKLTELLLTTTKPEAANVPASAF